MAYLDRIFEHAAEAVTIPNPLTFTGAQTYSANKTISSGYNLTLTKGLLNVGVFSSATQGSGVALARSGTNTAAVRFYADDAGAALTGTGSVPDIRGALSRVLLTVDNTGGHVRVHGLMGQLKAYDAYWNTEVVSALHGRLELVRSAETMTLGGYGISASVLGVVASSGTITVNTNHVLAGVAAISDFRATLTQTGKTAAFYAGAYDTTNWSDSTARTTWGFGLLIPKGAATQGIRVGDWVAAGASGSAFAFSTSMNFYADGQLDVVGAYGESTSNLTSAYSAKVGRFRHIATGSSLTVAHETYGLVGQMCGKGVTMTHLHAGLMGTFEGTGAAVVLNSSYTMGGHACVTARVGGHANITCTTPLAGFLAFNNASAAVASGTLSAFATSALSASYPWPIGIYMPATSVTQVASLNGVSTGIDLTVSTLHATTGRSLKIDGSVAAAAHADGYGTVEINANFSGAIAGPYAAASSCWVNLASGTTVSAGPMICTRNDGIYAPSGLTLTGAKMILGGRLQLVIDDGANPGSAYLWSTNIFSNALTAIFDINAIEDFSNTTVKSGGGFAIPFMKVNASGSSPNTVYYLNLYTS